jgi:hypothetical protein
VKTIYLWLVITNFYQNFETNAIICLDTFY